MILLNINLIRSLAWFFILICWTRSNFYELFFLIINFISYLFILYISQIFVIILKKKLLFRWNCCTFKRLIVLWYKIIVWGIRFTFSCSLMWPVWWFVAYITRFIFIKSFIFLLWLILIYIGMKWFNILSYI